MFVPADEIHLEWNEPYFFRFRTLGARGFLLPCLVFLVLCILFSTAIALEPQSVKGSRGLLQTVLLLPLSSAVITVLVTAPSVRRRITLSRDGISWSNLYPTSLFFLSSPWGH